MGSAATTNACPNGLNQYDAVGASTCPSAGTAYTYDDRGNLTSGSSRTYVYDVENRLTQTSSGTAGAATNWGAANWNAFQWSGAATSYLEYDPLSRLRQTAEASGTKQYLYDGDALVAEYDASGTLLRRYVPGQGVDETLVWYEGADLTDRYMIHTDQQGSVVAASNTSGIAPSTYAYGPFGEPSGGFASGGPAFRYTGQVQLAGLQLYYFKARMYDPASGRFLQTDPLGYSQGMNLYAYVLNDPANATDPSGMEEYCYDNFFIMSDGSRRYAGGGCIQVNIGIDQPAVPWNDVIAQRNANNAQNASAGGFQQVGLRPPFGLAGPVREALRQLIMSTFPKSIFPKNAAGLTPAQFGELAGLSSVDKAFRGINQAEINGAIQRLKNAGITKNDVKNAADFYSETAWRDIGNQAAAFRSIYLQQIARGW